VAKSNRDRVGEALELLRAGLYPFVERELKTKFGDQWETKGRESLGAVASLVAASPQAWDVAALLSIIDTQWQYVFRHKLGKSDRTLVFELRDVRNRWAHQEPFSLDDANRALDSAKRLLLSVNAPEAAEVDRQMQEVLRQKFEELSRREGRKAAASGIEGKYTTGLPPWREVIVPHADVASGNYLMAEFAADLWQVYQGQFQTDSSAPEEYSNPVEFFRRTFLTDGLLDLLRLGTKRICKQPADPVVKLQTNFGGGKTHSMLALYHLFSGVSPTALPGVEPLLKELGISNLPKVHRAVLVGNKLSLTGFKKPDGITVRTLWGELAWQLGHSAGRAKEAYEMVRADDQQGVCPSALVDLLKAFSPCLVLIDEWVAFVRQLYDTPGLAAGSFDANLTFAQSLTEAFKAVPGALLVASLPASDIEIGGEGGQNALKRLENTFDRVQSTWRPATTDECFEIVRRRLFQPVTADNFAARDAVARAFADMYRQAGTEYPDDCRQAAYERRLQTSYPIHPELFDRLFQDWSKLDRFQKTRGVLRLMAAVIHCLWERQDANLLIMPATLPMDDPTVRDELVRYLDENWTPVIEKDVDGPNALPLRLDRENPTFGRVSAARRVARTLYLGSAPTAGDSNPGIDDRRIRAGCVQPGETSATFGDALRRLSDQATHVYVDQGRYWLGTTPSVRRLAQDRAAQFARDTDRLHTDIVRRIREEQASRGDFVKVHPCPVSSSDVPDEREVRLVILTPEQPHSAKSTDSPGLTAAKSIFETRGSSPRLFRNTLVFLAPDKSRLASLEEAVAQALAWQSIVTESEALNLTSSQSAQARTKAAEANDTVQHRLPETFQWLLMPQQSTPQSPVEWTETRLQGADKLAPRASRKLLSDAALVTRYAGTLLRMELDRIPLWRGDSVSVKQLVDDFAQYLYLPRLKSPQVLLDAVREGVNTLVWQSEGFAYADAVAPDTGRFVGLRVTSLDVVNNDGRSVVVRPQVAAQQFEQTAREQALAAGAAHPAADASGTKPGQAPPQQPGPAGRGSTPPPAAPPKRFYATLEVAPQDFTKAMNSAFNNVIAELAAMNGVKLTLTLEVHAERPAGIDPATVRSVSENCRVLKFRTFQFEQE